MVRTTTTRHHKYSPNGELCGDKAPKWLLVTVEVDSAKAGGDGKLKDGVLETPKAGLLDVEFD
jgi:hypothetical protein